MKIKSRPSTFWSILFFVCLGLSTKIHGQVAVGISGKLTSNRVETKKLDPKLLLPFDQGLFYLYAQHIAVSIHGKNPYAGLLFELGYNKKGWWEIRKEIQSNKVELDYFELNTLAKVYVKKGWFRPYFIAGIYVGYLNDFSSEIVGGVDKDDDGFDFPSYTFTQDDKKYDYGVVGGFGSEFQVWQISFAPAIRFNYGLVSLLNETNPTKRGFMQNFQAGFEFVVLYHFKKKKPRKKTVFDQ